MRHREPDRQDLRHLAKGLRKDMEMIDQYLSNYTRYATQSFQITNQGFDQLLAARKNSISMPGGSLVNPIFNPLESGRSVSYIFDPLKVGAENYVGEIQPQNVKPNILQSFPKSLEMLPQSHVEEKYGSFILNPMLIRTTPLSSFSSASGYDSEIEFASQHMEASTSKSQVSPSHDNSHEMQPSTSKSQVSPSHDISHEMQPSTSRTQVSPSHDNSYELQPSTSNSQVSPSHDNSQEMRPSTSKSPIGPNMPQMINTRYSQPSTSRPHVQQESPQREYPQQIQRLNIPPTSFQPIASMSHARKEIQGFEIPPSSFQPSTSESFTKRSSREIEAQVRAASISMYSTDFNGSYSSSNNITGARGNNSRQSKLRAQPKYMQENIGNLPLDLLHKTTPTLQSAPSTPKNLPVIKLGSKRGLSIIVADPECIGTP